MSKSKPHSQESRTCVKMTYHDLLCKICKQIEKDSFLMRPRTVGGNGYTIPVENSIDMEIDRSELS